MGKKSKKGGIPNQQNRAQFKRKSSTPLQQAMDNTRLGNVLEAATRITQGQPVGPRSMGKSLVNKPLMNTKATTVTMAPTPPVEVKTYTVLDTTKPWLEYRQRGVKKSTANVTRVEPDGTRVPMGVMAVDFHLSAVIEHSRAAHA